uniref:Putative secreted protein n=1 Tax=Anopheles triannulatus TaxID=58253 RepID=A0A2M4B4P7_9DIPT
MACRCRRVSVACWWCFEFLLYHHLQIATGRVLCDTHVLHIRSIDAPLCHLTEALGQRKSRGGRKAWQRALTAAGLLRAARR